MKLIEIAGHLIDPGKVSYVGPVRDHLILDDISQFNIVVDGERISWQFAAVTVTTYARRDLLAAIESAQPETTELEATTCCVSWHKHDDDMQKRMREAMRGAVAILNEGLYPAPQLNEKGEYLYGDCWPKHPEPNKSSGDNGITDASDALVGVEA